MGHGGDWARFQRDHGVLPLDFSINVDPLGTPGPVREAAAQALSCVERYPDPRCRALRSALAERFGVPVEDVLCGGGAADLIYRLALARRPRRALVVSPTFSEYALALELAGCSVARHPLSPEAGFAVEEDILDALVPGVEMVFLCEPNNPTGRTTPRALLEAVLDRCRDCGALAVVDECFNEFLDDPAAHSLTGEVSRRPELLILRAFTKSFGLAGLRLGYALCGDPALLEAMERSGPPWNVSAPAQAAGLASLRVEGHLEAVRRLLRTERPRLASGLRDLGCGVIPGEANFLLFRHGAPGLLPGLEERGILLRDCGDDPGLGPGWYRTAVRTMMENDRLLRALREVL